MILDGPPKDGFTVFTVDNVDSLGRTYWLWLAWGPRGTSCGHAESADRARGEAQAARYLLTEPARGGDR